MNIVPILTSFPALSNPPLKLLSGVHAYPRFLYIHCVFMLSLDVDVRREVLFVNGVSIIVLEETLEAVGVLEYGDEDELQVLRYQQCFELWFDVTRYWIAKMVEIVAAKASPRTKGIRVETLSCSF